jgi:ATP-binding cassette, subfamily B, bacterial
MTDKKKYNHSKLYRRLFFEIRPYFFHLAGILLVTLLSTPLALLTPLPLKIAVDSVIGSHPLPTFLQEILPGTLAGSPDGILIFIIAFTIIIAVLSGFQRLASSWLRIYTGEKLTLAFRTKLFRHVQRLSVSYHDSKGTADSTYRIQYCAPGIQWLAVDGVIPFIATGLTVIGMIYIVAILDWQLAVVAIAISPVLYMGARTFNPRIRNQWGQIWQLESSAFSVVQEALSALRVVKAFGQEEREQERFVRHSSESFLARVRAAWAEGGFGLLIGITTAAGTAGVLFLGVRHVQTGSLTLGDLLLVMSYLTQLFGPLATLSDMTANAQRSFASAERAFALLDEEPDVIETKNALPLLSSARGSITFRDVCFAYNGDYPVLSDISFAIKPGTRVGIMGMTGGGKSTLVSLLTRFHDPTRGQILLDGVDLRDYKLPDLRNQFGIVLQESILFSTSIGENIAYARPGVSQHEIVEAAKAANAHEFITGLPDGYDTMVGERGMQLSGGQRQRIALARAFLKNAPILILDEPTSSIDIKTEREIIQVMERLSVGRTVFIIAHRLSTLKHCDLVLGIEQGRVVSIRSDVAKALADTSDVVEAKVYSLS